MRTPNFDLEMFRQRRSRLAQKMNHTGALIAPAAPEYIRNNDVHHPYRQDSNMYYLTGFEEPESVLLFRPGKIPETVLFVRNKDKERETWDGFRYGPEGAKEQFNADQTFLIEDFEKECSHLLQDVEKVYYTLFHDLEFDERISRVILNVRDKRRRSGRGLLSIYDAYPLIGEMRLFKTPEEIELLREACLQTSLAHNEIMKYIKPGMNEREIHGRFIYEIMKRGAAREGYGTIVAGGFHATTLHYVYNDQKLKDGDLLLIDAGGEFQYYTGDVTRTYPVNGRFTPPQKRLYQKVLDLQKKLFEQVQPGLLFKHLQESAISGLVDIMIDEGLLKGAKSEIIKEGRYRIYYPHGVSHWLGMDVHDSGMIEMGGISRPLEQGMCFTIEPGFYIRHDDFQAPAELRGIGIRIEDNVVVTEKGCENLTQLAVKEVDQLESIIGSGCSSTH